ncbi:MAG: hypothetical protein ACRET8_00210 [Burkholderiales bacterium]
MRILAALLAVISLDCAATPFVVRLGIERIAIDAPPGFTDTTDLASPRLESLSSILTSASNRILLFALTDADVRAFTEGDQIHAQRYALVVTPKGLEGTRATPKQFSELVSDASRNLGAKVDAPDLIKFLQAQPIGKLNLLADLRREPEIVSVLVAVRLPEVPGEKFWNFSTPQYQVSSETLMLVRGKALRLSVYTLYGSPADLDWVREITSRWQEEIRRLNH